MLDWKGNLSDPKHRQRIILEDIPENDEIADASLTGSIEPSAITNLLNKQIPDGIKPMFEMIPPENDEVASVLFEINPIYDDKILHARLSKRTCLSKYQMSVGSTTATRGQHILDDVDLVCIMDGSLMAGSYNGYTIGSMMGSIFDKDPMGSKEGSATPPDVNIEDINNQTPVDPINTPIINKLF